MFSKTIAKIKDRFTKVVQVPCYSPGPCPKCGAVIEVLMTRGTSQSMCGVCGQVSHTMGVGIIDVDKERLKHIHADIIQRINKSSIEYDRRKLLH